MSGAKIVTATALGPSGSSGESGSDSAAAEGAAASEALVSVWATRCRPSTGGRVRRSCANQKLGGHLYEECIHPVAAEIGRPDKIGPCHIQIPFRLPGVHAVAASAA